MSNVENVKNYGNKDGSKIKYQDYFVLSMKMFRLQRNSNCRLSIPGYISDKLFLCTYTSSNFSTQYNFWLPVEKDSCKSKQYRQQKKLVKYQKRGYKIRMGGVFSIYEKVLKQQICIQKFDHDADTDTEAVSLIHIPIAIDYA